VDINVIKDFDVRGTNPNNTVVKEEIVIKDKTCPWVIPNGAPFFGDYPVNNVAIVTVYNAAGVALTRDTDYWVEEEFIPLVAVTGRPIMCFIRLSDAVLAANAKVFVSYQSTGAYFVVRNGLQQLLDKVQKPERVIDWNQVIEIPATFPAGHHWHNIKTELGDWFELTKFFVHIAKSIQQRPYAPWQQISTPIKAFFDQLYAARDLQNTRTNTHSQDYNNPHVYTKVLAEMDKHPNYATGTVADHITGTASNLLATPEGVMAIVDDATLNTDNSMDLGVMPISRYGGESYIPPNISGSFEGLGGLSVSSAIVLEKSGLLMMVTAHNDGRNAGLYYSYCNDYNNLKANIVFTGFKYEAPSLLSRGFSPTTVIPGSSGELMMVADLKTSEYYLALANGTLEASAHQYVKMDMSAVWAKVGNTYKDNEDRTNILRVGDYAILHIANGSGINELSTFFKCPLSALVNATDAAWVHMPVTYRDYDGVQYTNADSYRPWVWQRSADNTGYSKMGPMTYLQPATTLNKNGRTGCFAAKHDSNSALGYVAFVMYANASRLVNGASATAQSEQVIAYLLNPVTGAMTESSRPPTIEVDFVNMTQPQRDASTQRFYRQFYNSVIQNSSASVTILDNGDIIISTSGSGLNFPRSITVIIYEDRVSGGDVLSKPMDKVAAPLKLAKTTNPLLMSPLLSGTTPSRATYEPDGELYMAQDLAANNRKVYFRSVTGPYAVRPELTNLTYANVKSRPLTNDVYNTNLTYEDPPIGMSGTAAVLSAGATECGSTSFAMMGYSSMGARHTFPRATLFKAPAANNMVLSCPRTHSKTIESAAKRVTYKADTFWGCRQDLLDKFQAMIPPEYTDYLPWSVSISMLQDVAGGAFKGLNLGLAIISFSDPSKAFMRLIHVLFRPVIENPNADHPDVYLIKDITELDRTAAYRSSANVRVAEQQLVIPGAATQSSLQMYRDATTLQAFSILPYSTNSVSTIYTRQISWMVINLTTNKFDKIVAHSVGWSPGDLTVAIPKVGFSDFVIGTGTTTENGSLGFAAIKPYDATGGVGRVFSYTNPDNSVDIYMGPTGYPAVGWTVFFQDGVGMMVNGTPYSVAGISIDLRDIDPNPTNKTFYVYVTLEDRRGRYVISDTKLRHSARRMHVATITTSATQILTIERFQPFLLGDLELSTFRKGGSIPVSSGQPQVDGDFVFLKQSELLP